MMAIVTSAGLIAVGSLMRTTCCARTIESVSKRRIAAFAILVRQRMFCGRIFFTILTMSTEICTHIDAITDIKLAKQRVCEECVKIGSTWVHLRTCQECGGTRCCDSSPNRHATKHAHATGHPVIASAEPGERWLYCYPDDAFAEY